MKFTRLYRPPTIVFDIDGTLVDASSTKDLVSQSLQTQDFDALHEVLVDSDPIHWVVQHAYEAKRMGFRVIQLTARQERYRKITESWLMNNEVPSDALYMRANGDFRPDYDVKKELLDRLLKSYDIKKAFDDNPTVVRLWNEYKIPCIVVPGWEG